MGERAQTWYTEHRMESQTKPSEQTEKATYVEVTLEVPNKLNARQKRAIEDMAKAVDASCYQEQSGFKRKLKEIFGF